MNLHNEGIELARQEWTIHLFVRKVAPVCPYNVPICRFPWADLDSNFTLKLCWSMAVAFTMMSSRE
jgi:hypothetical protein